MSATTWPPLHPRKASAGRVRHHRKYLAFRLRLVAPGAHIVRATPVPAGDGWAFVVLALDAQRQAIRLPRGGHARISELLRGAFPAARWDRTQTWRADQPDAIAEYAPMGATS